MKIKIVITTCKHYFNINIPPILDQIESCNIPKNDVIIISGQEESKKKGTIRDVNVISVTYSAMHLTGLIYIYENISDFNNIDYWIALPCTVKFGKSFYNKITQLIINKKKYLDEIYCIPFINPRIRPPMDMGIFNTKHLINMKNYLYKIKLRRPFNDDELKKLKTQLILDEGMILGLPMKYKPWVNTTKFKYSLGNNYDHKKDFNNFIINFKKDIIEKDLYINNKLCNEVYLECIDLYKYQRNFQKTIQKPFENVILDI